MKALAAVDCSGRTKGVAMNIAWILALAILMPSALIAQEPLPPGTLLPVSLDRTLNAAKARPGQEVRGEVMQNIPGSPVRRRAHVTGRVIAANATRGGAARLEIRFDQVEQRGRRIPIRTDLRALASFVEVEEAQVPEEGASRGITPEVATTRQIGGDQVYRGGGPVAEGLVTVGAPTPYGVLAVPRTSLGQPCRGVVGNDRRPQALWLFSADACGVYGFGDIRIDHSGRTDPVGNIVLVAARGKLVLPSGTALLLRVE